MDHHWWCITISTTIDNTRGEYHGVQVELSKSLTKALFHVASDFSYEHYLEHRPSLLVIRLLVVRISRKHNACIDGHCR